MNIDSTTIVHSLFDYVMTLQLEILMVLLLQFNLRMKGWSV